MYGYYFLAFAGLIVIAVAARYLLTRAAILTLEDAIVLPGEKPVLVAWLERKLFLFVDPNIPEVEIELHGPEGVIGTAKTGPNGKARIEMAELPAGLHTVRAKLVEGSRYRTADAEGYIAVYDANEPVFVTDIDKTVADCTPVGFITRRNESVKTLPGAPTALQELSRSMRIIYLSARDHIFIAKTRDWLRKNSFPEGPVLLRRLRFTQATALEHKLTRLKEVVARLKNIRYGVGDMPHDVEAYRQRGIRPILISPGASGKVEEGVETVRSWEEILTLMRQG